MNVILSHPTANSFVRSAVYALQKQNMLSEFHTEVATFPGNFLDKLGSMDAFSGFRRRSFDESIRHCTHTWPWLELSRQLAQKIGFNKLVEHEKGLFSVDAVYRNLDKRVASRLKHQPLNSVNGIYAYEDGALYSFREAKKLGLQCFYDLPIGYWRAALKYLEVERNRWPDWAPTLKSLKDSDFKHDCKDEELKMADRIFVASSFTAKTLQEYPGKLAPVDVVPYCFPPAYENRTYIPYKGKAPLKLLFVGSLSQRKGLANLFAAVNALGKHVSLTVVGLKASKKCPALDAELKKHHWIPSLPHAEVLQLMRAHDVLVFPSLFEGFGLVITEAMSQGTPVITTERTAGPDIIEHGRNGWIIEAGSTEALQQAIEELLSNPDEIIEVGREAINTAKKSCWTNYEKGLVKSISNHLSVSGVLSKAKAIF